MGWCIAVSKVISLTPAWLMYCRLAEKQSAFPRFLRLHSAIAVRSILVLYAAACFVLSYQNLNLAAVVMAYIFVHAKPVVC